MRFITEEEPIIESPLFEGVTVRVYPRAVEIYIGRTQNLAKVLHRIDKLTKGLGLKCQALFLLDLPPNFEVFLPNEILKFISD